MSIINKIKRLLKGKKHDELSVLVSRGLQLGKNVRIYSDYAIDSEWPWLISIGDNTMISTNVKILAHDASTSFLEMGTKVGRVDIGKNVFIGSGSIVLCGVEIGDNSIIGAGSVVSKNVEPNSVYAGVPAKFICSIDELKEKYKDAIVCDQYSWDSWKDAPIEDKKKMRGILKNSVGFVR